MGEAPAAWLRARLAASAPGVQPEGGRRDTGAMSSGRGAATSTERARRRTRGRLWWFGILLGGLLVAAGVAETVRLLRSGDGGFAFWFGTLVGGGVLILVGTVLLPRKPAAGGVLTVIGCLAGLLPTMWTIVVPVLLIALAVAAAQHATGAAAREVPPG